MGSNYPQHGGRLLIDRLVVVRLNKEGKPMLAKPCEICQRMIKDFGVKHVSYTK